ANRNPENVLGFLELHIEQGAALERLNAQIGIVRGIVGRTTHQLTFQGERGHSGTTDIYNRKDALQGAALFVTRAHQLANDRFDGTIVNCGRLEVFPGTFNVIPERATMLVECRHVDETTLLNVEQELLQLAGACADTFGLSYETERVEHMDAAHMDPDMISVIERVCARMDIRHTSMVSYAGHDAQPMSHFTPSGMIFVPSKNGISHQASEYSEWDDVMRGVDVLLQAVLELADIFTQD
ncbi:MAG: hydantoinase/carbamoylase family amidase, partial [Chloroflexota bacterium]